MSVDAATIAVLVPGDGTPPPPESRPIGRAALRLADQGIQVIFGHAFKGGRMDGMMAQPGGWTHVRGIQVDAIHDRFPSQIRAEAFSRILDSVEGLIMGNPLAFTELCRDKIACQATMESQGITMPALETNPRQFQVRLEHWGAGFIKPRYGALGAGVAKVTPGDALPSDLIGVVPGRKEPAILQAAVPPPAGWAGRALRVLVQRTPSGWHQCPPVVRSSKEDPVANAARGAAVAAGPKVLSVATLSNIEEEVHAITAGLDRCPEAAFAVEAGLDLVLDSQEKPHLIEINSRPRGRLEVLAQHDPEGFEDAHVEACARPLRMLAWWAKR